MPRSAQKPSKIFSAGNSTTATPAQLSIGYPFPKPTREPTVSVRLDFKDVAYKVESMKLLSKQSRPKHAYHENVYHTTSNQSGLEVFAHGRRHFAERVSLSREELFRPSLGKTKHSDRSYASNLKTPISEELRPWTTKKRRSEGFVGRMSQFEINQIAADLPSMRQRGSAKNYDKSKFVGQLDYFGLGGNSNLSGAKYPSNRTNTGTIGRRIDPTRSDSSRMKGVLAGGAD